MPVRCRLPGAVPALLGLLMASDPARAEEAPPPPIVVTGHGLGETPGKPAYAVTTLTRGEIISAPSGRIEDVLASVAGFQQFRRSDSRSSNPSAQGVTLRALGGNASSRALVLLDGVPMTDPFFGYVPLSALAPERLGRIVVTRGGGSGPFGAGALSGTIELESADAATLGLANGSLAANHRGEAEASATLAPELGRGFAVISGRWDRGQGFWTTPRSQRVPASARAGFEAWSVSGRIVQPLGEALELQARALAFGDDRTLRFAGADTTSSGEDVSARLVGKGHWQFDALGYVQRRNFTNVVVSATRFVPTLDQRNTPSRGLGGKLELRPPLGKAHVLRLGMDYRRASGELFEDALSVTTGAVTARRNAGGKQADLGFYAEHDWTPGALTVTAGARADRWTIRGGFFTERNAAGALTVDNRFADRAGWTGSLRGGALLRVSPVLSLRAAAYTGLRLPTLNELYRPFTVVPVTTRANAALRPERLVGYEAGVNLVPAQGVTLAVTLFDNRVKDAVANVTIGANLRQRQNLPAIVARGVEASGELRRGDWRLSGSLSLTDAKVKGRGASLALDGKRPAQTPAIATSATLAYAPTGGPSAALTLRHVGRQFEDDLEVDALPPATTIDAHIRLPLGHRAALVLRGENLTAETIVTRNAGGSIDTGAPRTLWAGFDWSL